MDSELLVRIALDFPGLIAQAKYADMKFLGYLLEMAANEAQTELSRKDDADSLGQLFRQSAR